MHGPILMTHPCRILTGDMRHIHDARGTEHDDECTAESECDADGEEEGPGAGGT